MNRLIKRRIPAANKQTSLGDESILIICFLIGQWLLCNNIYHDISNIYLADQKSIYPLARRSNILKQLYTA